MRRLTFILTIGLLGLFCNWTIGLEKFKGDLYFKLISIGSFYKADSIKVKTFVKSLDSLMKIDPKQLSQDNLELVKVYGGLRKNGLIDKPFFSLRIDSTTIYIVYTNETEFKKISGYNHSDLLKGNKKIQIELTGEIINLGTLNVLNCSTIDKIEKVDGKTYWRK